jgi:hypothetical protein
MAGQRGLLNYRAICLALAEVAHLQADGYVSTAEKKMSVIKEEIQKMSKGATTRSFRYYTGLAAPQEFFKKYMERIEQGQLEKTIQELHAIDDTLRARLIW